MPNPLPTRWCVLTGAPSSGKTSTLHALENKGFQCVPEGARVYIEEQLELGRTIQEIRADEGVFQAGLMRAKITVENSLDPQTIVFLDRALPDSITYYRIAGLDPQAIAEVCQKHRYAYVFAFDPLPWDPDGIRIENAEESHFLDVGLEEDYRNLGYEVIRVPVLSVEERVNFILNQIHSSGN